MHPMLRMSFECVRSTAKTLLNAYQRFNRHPDQPISEKLYEQLVSELQQRYPYLHFIGPHDDIAVLAGLDTEWICIVNPLDGEENFNHSIPLFSISLTFARLSSRSALYELEMALVYDPIHDLLFHAQKGHGTFINQKRLRIHTPNWNNTTFIGQPLALIQLTNEGYRQMLENAQPTFSTRQFNSPALSIAMVANAQADGVIIDSAHPVSTSAGILLILEAGGMVLSLEKEEYHWSNPGTLLLGHATFCGWLQHHWKK